MSIARRIGPFALAELISQGPDSALYKAVRSGERHNPKEVCMRVAKNPLDNVVSLAIQNEYSVLKAMDNQRIPSVFGYFPEDVAIATSFIGGVNLSEILQAQREGLVRIAAGTAIDIAVEVAHALRHASNVIDSTGNRIVHGHLTPSDIHLRPDGNVVVTGFGANPSSSVLAYVAPEIMRGEMSSPQSDQWSLASMLIELISGEALYTDAGDIQGAARTGDIGHWLRMAIQAQPELEVALTTMLALDPEKRFARGHQLLKALLAAGRLIGGTVSRRSLVNQILSTKTKSPQPVEKRSPPSQRSALSVANTMPNEPELMNMDFGSFSELEPVARVDDVLHELSSIPESPTPPNVPRNSEPIDFFSPPAPDPVPSLLPSEFAGMALGGLMVLLGLTYVFWVL